MAEAGSDLAEELWATSSMRISSQLLYPETRAALAAATRAGRIDAQTLRRAVVDLDRAAAAMRLIGIDDALARAAGGLAEEHALRGYDAVHLGTALGVDDPGLLVVTWDRELASAARACGHPVAPASLPSNAGTRPRGLPRAAIGFNGLTPSQVRGDRCPTTP